MAGVVVVLVYAGAGWAAARYIGDAQSEKEAFYYGLAWQTVIGGVINAGYAASKVRRQFCGVQGGT